jgi:hypothetical protein
VEAFLLHAFVFNKGLVGWIKNLNHSVGRPSSIIVFWIAIHCLFLVQITSVIWFEWALLSSYYSRLVLILNELRQDNVFSCLIWEAFNLILEKPLI